jgi:hypothetical protein
MGLGFPPAFYDDNNMPTVIERLMVCVLYGLQTPAPAQQVPGLEESRKALNVSPPPA